jgi:hypothetical protein
MKTIEIKLYKFDELSEEAQQEALKSLYYVNIDDEWWNAVYEDAEQVGLKITGFDIGRGNYCELEFVLDATEIADAIIKEHGEHCDTHKTAKDFMKERDNLVYKYSDKKNTEVVAEDNEYEFDQECDELEDELEKAISEDYLAMLRKDYEYYTSEEAIKETIQANDYDFTEEGSLY